MLDIIENMEQEKIGNIAMSLLPNVNVCLTAGSKHKVPSAAEAFVKAAQMGTFNVMSIILKSNIQ